MYVHVGFVGGIDFVADDADFGGLHDALDEEGAGDDEAYLDGYGKVKYDGEEEGHKEYGDVALGVFEQAFECAPAAHVVADDDEYACEGGHGYVAGVGHEDEEYEEQDEGVYDAGYGGAASVVDVGHGAGYGSCGRDSAEKWCDDVSCALCDEFHVGVVAVADDAIGYGC